MAGTAAVRVPSICLLLDSSAAHLLDEALIIIHFLALVHHFSEHKNSLPQFVLSISSPSPSVISSGVLLRDAQGSDSRHQTKSSSAQMFSACTVSAPLFPHDSSARARVSACADDVALTPISNILQQAHLV
jgi:hypothetical protein